MKLTIALVVSIVVLSLCGCSGDSVQTAGTTVTRISELTTATPVVTPSLLAPEVQQVVVAATAKDAHELAGLSGYQRLPCASNGSGPVACRPGEAAGDEVELLAVSACDDRWVRPEAVSAAFRFALEPEVPRLVAVYHPAYRDVDAGRDLGATTVAVFDTGTRSDGASRGTALHLNRGRVVWVEADCPDLSELLSTDRIASWIIEPR